MRVLHVINGLPTGGAERLLTDLVPRLRARGIDCSVLSIESTATEFGRKLEEQGVPVASLDAFHAYSPLAALKLVMLIRRHDCDLVHAHLYPAQLWAAIACRLSSSMRRPLLVTEHNTDNWRWSVPPLRPMERWMYRQADGVACISAAAEVALRAAVGEIKAVTILNGIDLSRLRAEAVTSGNKDWVPPSPLTLLSVGRLVSQKGYHRLIDAMVHLGQDVHLVVCGDGPLRDSLQQRAIRHGVDRRLHLLGTRRDVACLMNHATVYVQPSMYEGFGLAALEAMACGLPVVHSGCAGLADIVGAGGLAANADDPREFARVLRRVLEDAGLRSELGERARARAQQFSIDRTADDYAALYAKLVA